MQCRSQVHTNGAAANDCWCSRHPCQIPRGHPCRRSLIPPGVPLSCLDGTKTHTSHPATFSSMIQPWWAMMRRISSRPSALLASSLRSRCVPVRAGLAARQSAQCGHSTRHTVLGSEYSPACSGSHVQQLAGGRQNTVIKTYLRNSGGRMVLDITVLYMTATQQALHMTQDAASLDHHHSRDRVQTS